MPLAHPFYFLLSRRDTTRDLREFMVRDAVANQHIVEALRPQGFSLGEARINNPPPVDWPEDPTQLAHVDTDDCRPEDVLVTSTRWPVSDHEQGCRKRVPRAYTDLEEELLEVWSRYLPVLARDQVRLHADFHALLPAGLENRYDMVFYEREGAPYNALRAYHGRGHRPYAGQDERTAAFLLRLPRLPKREVGYIGAWAPDGTSNLVFADLLRHRHAELLREPGFVMVELVRAPKPPRPTDYRWYLEWRAQILFRAPLAGPHQPQHPARAA